MTDRSDFFVAALTVVPVLWITTALASTAVERIIARVRDARLSLTLKYHVWLLPRVTIKIEPDGIVERIEWFGRTVELSVDLGDRKNVLSAAVSQFSIFVFALAGAAAEVASLIALFAPATTNWVLALITFASSIVTVIGAAVLVFAALSALRADVFRSSDGSASICEKAST